MPFVDDAKELIHLKDTPSPLFFGKRRDAGDDKHFSSSSNWFWEFRGQLMILSSPHLVGKHFATSVSQLLGVVEHLEQLHNKGYVHGDIRAYNIVFIEEDVKNGIKPNGFLIDFDLGGKVGEESTKYPEGFTPTLNDGRRPVEGGSQITKQDDWHSLLYVLFFLHKVKPPIRTHGRPRSVQTRLQDAELFEDLSRFGSDFAFRNDPSSRDIEDLKQFLTKISTWDIMLEGGFQRQFNSCPLYGNNAALPGRGRTRVIPSTQSNELVGSASASSNSDDAAKSPRNKSGKRSWSPSMPKNRNGTKRCKSKCDRRHA
jgi:serine/threonine protein kinase